MQRLRACSLCSFLLANNSAFHPSFGAPSLPKRSYLEPVSCTYLGFPQVPRSNFQFIRRYMSVSANLSFLNEECEDPSIEILSALEDIHGGVTVSMEKPMDALTFSSILRASLSQWRQDGKKAVWVKLPLEFASLVEATVNEGFRFHHAEPDYLMLVKWISNTADILPENASHKVGIGAFVMNRKREVLVVQEMNGPLKGLGIWKLPTGGVNEGEDICMAAIREVKEETGVETEFVEVLAFRQSHKSFFRKSDFFFVCMLQPRTYDIQIEASEIEAAQWMPVEEYGAQPFVRQHELFNFVNKICLSKTDGTYAGFTPLSTRTSTGKRTHVYFNSRDANPILTSGN